ELTRQADGQWRCSGAIMLVGLRAVLCRAMCQVNDALARANSKKFECTTDLVKIFVVLDLSTNFQKIKTILLVSVRYCRARPWLASCSIFKIPASNHMTSKA